MRGRPKSNTVPVNVRLDKKSVELFKATYPDLLNLFLSRAVGYALESRQFFDEVFFHDLIVNRKV